MCCALELDNSLFSSLSLAPGGHPDQNNRFSRSTFVEPVSGSLTNLRSAQRQQQQQYDRASAKAPPGDTSLNNQAPLLVPKTSATAPAKKKRKKRNSVTANLGGTKYEVSKWPTAIH